MEIAWIPLLTAIAFVAAVISAIVGLGGGMVLLIAFYLVGMDPLLAIPLHACVQLVANAARIWVYREHAHWGSFLVFVLVSLPLPLLGLELLAHLDKSHVRCVFGALVLYVTWMPKWGIRGIGEKAALAWAGVVGGIFGVIVGATGPLVAPFLMYRDFRKEELVAQQALCAAWLHVIKIVAFGTIGFAVLPHLPAISPLIVAVIGGAFAGRWVLRRVPESHFRRAYQLVLTVAAVRLLLAPWWSI